MSAPSPTRGETRQDAIQWFCGLKQLQGIDHLAPEGRQRLLRALVDEIVVRVEAVEIHGVLPGRWTPGVRKVLSRLP